MLGSQGSNFFEGLFLWNSDRTGLCRLMLAIYDLYSYIPFIVLHEQMLLICNY